MPRYRLVFHVIESSECSIDVEADSFEEVRKAWDEDYVILPDDTLRPFVADAPLSARAKDGEILSDAVGRLDLDLSDSETQLTAIENMETGERHSFP